MRKIPKKRLQKRTNMREIPISSLSAGKMIPDERDRESSDRAFSAIEIILSSNEHYQKLKVNLETHEEVRNKLTSIAQSYWEGLQEYGSPGIAERKDDLEKVEKASVKLKGVLSGTPIPSRTDLSRKMRFRTKYDDKPLDLKGFEEHLESLIYVLGLLNKEPAPGGRPRKKHITRMVKQAAALWVELTGEKFNINLERGEDRDPTTGDLVNDIVAPSPRFVRSVALAIDPELTESEVLSAISTMNSNKQK